MKIFSKTIRLKNGHILIAQNYGLEAFCFEVTEEQNAEYHNSKNKIETNKKN